MPAMPKTYGDLEALPQRLVYKGEFGAEVVLFVPFCTWLHRAGLLAGRTVSTYRGMGCFYEHLDGISLDERQEARVFVRSSQRRWLPAPDEHTLRAPNPFHLYPDMRRLFASRPLDLFGGDPRPILVVHNKYNSEWHGRPVNFIGVAALDALFVRLKHRFNVVYIRHGIAGHQAGYIHDENDIAEFADAGVLARHPEVSLFDRLYETAGAGLDVNDFKNRLYARCFHFVTVQGGGAHHIAQFSGSLMTILHRKGREQEGAYADGYYSFMARPAPLRLVCPDPETLLSTFGLIERSIVVQGRAQVATQDADLADALSPHRFCAQQP